MATLDPGSLGQHIDRLYRAAWALCGSPHEAEDLVQETFTLVLARPRTLRGEDELGYLLCALRNTFVSSRRTASRRPVSGADIQELDPGDPRSGAQPEAGLEASEMFAAIAALPTDFRLALVAVDVVGLSHREAGDVLGAPEATIGTRVFRARRQVALALADPPLAAPKANSDPNNRGRDRERSGVRERPAW
jgi:RNA polymerase sigma-70 factor (ECF subfamily)